MMNSPRIQKKKKNFQLLNRKLLVMKCIPDNPQVNNYISYELLRDINIMDVVIDWCGHHSVSGKAMGINIICS